MLNQANNRARFLIVVLSAALLVVWGACTPEPEPMEPTVAPEPDIPATVQAEVAEFLAAAPSATPWPTYTPYPVVIAVPTNAPLPTATAQPAAAQPTAAPLPTHTPYPTATAYPTYTPYPTPTMGAVEAAQAIDTPLPEPVQGAGQSVAPRVVAATPMPAPSPTPGIFAALDSTDRADQILRSHTLGGGNCDRVAELSKELSKDHDVAILKIYDLRVVVSNSTRVECFGTARWSQGENSQVTVFVEHDRDLDAEGDYDRFYGYRLR